MKTDTIWQYIVWNTKANMKWSEITTEISEIKTEIHAKMCYLIIGGLE